MKFPRILPRLRLWLRGQKIRKQTFVLSERLHGATTVLQNEINAIRREIDQKQEQLDLLALSIQEYQQEVTRLEQEIDRLRAENKIHSEVTIPGLVEANSLVIDRIRAERSIEIGKHQIASER